MQPTLAGFIDFIRNVMGIDPILLPDNSPAIGWAYSIALMFVNPDLAAVAISPPAGVISTSIYIQAVYNFAGDRLVNFAPDQPGRTFFADLRTSLKINNFSAGVVSSASDGGTSNSIQVPDALKGLTLADLQRLKTPWGRAYLEFAQSAGTLWGVT